MMALEAAKLRARCHLFERPRPQNAVLSWPKCRPAEWTSIDDHAMMRPIAMRPMNYLLCVMGVFSAPLSLIACSSPGPTDDVPEAGVDSSMDAGTEVAMDAGFEVAMDAGFEVAVDAGFEVAMDAGFEVSMDASPPDADLSDDVGLVPDVGPNEDAGSDPVVWEWDSSHSNPLSMQPPPFESTTHPLLPSARWGGRGAPLPTNVAWSNVFVGSGEQRINMLPYHLRAQLQGLAIGRPGLTVAERSITTSAEVSLRLGAVESFTASRIVNYGLFSVSLEWQAGAGTLRAQPIYGSPYVTARYAGLRPRITTGGPAILSVNGASSSPVAGRRFELLLNNGKRWILYADAEVTLEWNTTSLTATGSFTGRLRAALVPGNGDASELDAYANVVVTGVSLAANITGDDARLTFNWQTDGAQPPLIMAMPHHQDRLVAASFGQLRYGTLFGEMRAVVGPVWELSYPLSGIEWEAPTAIDPASRGELEAALATDSNYVPDPLVVDGDPYFGGKQLAKLARLIQIARALGQDSTVDTLVERLRPLSTAWLEGTNSNPLLYDATWGGIISTNGRGDPGADFGQGYYNDHHFHYGYHIYAAAVLAREDRVWADTHREAILALIRDIMNPSRADPSFPRYRHMDFFVGHSWTAGLFEFADARNQESTSEAVNAYYAVQLYALATGETDLAYLAELLAAVEIASAQRYWQVDSTDNIYPPPFANFGCVGVLWATKVDALTFFGGQTEFVYGIQMLPYTPITEALLDRNWVDETWPRLSTTAANAEEPWAGLLYLAYGVVDAEAARREIRTLSDYDDGNSLTNSLWWLATRPR